MNTLYTSHGCSHRITNKEPLSLSKTLPILPASPPLPVQSQVVRRGRTQSGCVTGRRTISAQRRHVQAAVHQQINAFDTDNIVLPYTGTPLGMSRYVVSVCTAYVCPCCGPCISLFVSNDSAAVPDCVVDSRQWGSVALADNIIHTLEAAGSTIDWPILLEVNLLGLNKNSVP